MVKQHNEDYKLSALFNAWREMCRIHDLTNIPIRCVPMVAGQFPEQKTKNLALAPPSTINI